MSQQLRSTRLFWSDLAEARSHFRDEAFLDVSVLGVELDPLPRVGELISLDVHGDGSYVLELEVMAVEHRVAPATLVRDATHHVEVFVSAVP